MANRPITLKINVTKIDKSQLYHGKNGVYLDVVLFPNKNGKGQYGDTHFACQGISKEAREAGGRGEIIGSATFPDATPPQGRAPKQQRQQQEHTSDGGDGMDDSDFIPF